MDDPSENYDNEPIEEAQDPIDQPALNGDYDSDDDDDLPEFANDENKKLNQLVREKKESSNKLIKNMRKILKGKKS